MSDNPTTHPNTDNFNDVIEQLSLNVSYIRNLITETYSSVIKATAHVPLEDPVNLTRLRNIENFCFNLLSDIHCSL